MSLFFWWTAAAAAPYFEEVTEQLGAQPCDPVGCYSHYAQMADLDGDGDLDFLFASGGGYYEPADAQPLLLYRNDGASFVLASDTAFGGHSGRHRQISIGDIDGDLDLDVIAPDSYALTDDAVFINDGTGNFVDEGAVRLPVRSRAGGARLGDLDGDLDLDLVLTDWGDMPPSSEGTAVVWLNDGSGSFQESPAAVPQDTAGIGTGPIDVDLLDIDGDWDLDLLLASREGDSLLFRNNGAGIFVDANGDLPQQQGPYVYGPDPCDVDADLDLDLWLDNASTQLSEQLLLNDGAGKFTDVTVAQVQPVPFADDNEVQCVDIDDDGDFDAMVAALGDEERVLENDGLGVFSRLLGVFPTGNDSTLGLDIGDLDGDGRLDVITAQGESGDFTNRVFLGTTEQAVDSHPPTLRAISSIADGTALPAVVRFAVSDRMTTDTGPRLSDAWAECTVGTTTSVSAAQFVGGDLFAAVLTLPPGAGFEPSAEWRVCVTDPVGLSTCSEAVSFLLPEASGSGGSGTGASGGTGATGGTGGTTDTNEGSGAKGSQTSGCACDHAAPSTWAWVGLLLLAIRRQR